MIQEHTAGSFNCSSNYNSLFPLQHSCYTRFALVPISAEIWSSGTNASSQPQWPPVVYNRIALSSCPQRTFVQLQVATCAAALPGLLLLPLAPRALQDPAPHAAPGIRTFICQDHARRFDQHYTPAWCDVVENKACPHINSTHFPHVSQQQPVPPSFSSLLLP